jgi:hypothetical protein
LRYCRTASSTIMPTSRPCFAARFRSCSSTLASYCVARGVARNP